MESCEVIGILTKIIEEQDVSIASVARRMGKTTQALNKQLHSDNMRITTLLEILEAMHCDIDITLTDRATGRKFIICEKNSNTR